MVGSKQERWYLYGKTAV